MKKIFMAAVLLCALTVIGFGQTSAKTDASLELAMQKFRSSIIAKNPTIFLSYISRTKGLTIMNTIDQGEAGNVDKPMFVENLKYTALAADFKKKGEHYENFFFKSKDDPSLYDNFAGWRGKWRLGADNKFMPVDKTDGSVVKALYTKWEKEGNRWVVVEIGRMIS